MVIYDMSCMASLFLEFSSENWRLGGELEKHSSMSLARICLVPVMFGTKIRKDIYLCGRKLSVPRMKNTARFPPEL